MVVNGKNVDTQRQNVYIHPGTNNVNFDDGVEEIHLKYKMIYSKVLFFFPRKDTTQIHIHPCTHGHTYEKFIDILTTIEINQN